MQRAPVPIRRRLALLVASLIVVALALAPGPALAAGVGVPRTPSTAPVRAVYGSGSVSNLGDYWVAATSFPSGNGLGIWKVKPTALGDTRWNVVALECVVTFPGTDHVALFGRLARTIDFHGRTIIWLALDTEGGVALLTEGTSVRCAPEGLTGYFSGFFSSLGTTTGGIHVWPH